MCSYKNITYESRSSSICELQLYLEVVIAVIAIVSRRNPKKPSTTCRVRLALSMSLFV